MTTTRSAKARAKRRRLRRWGLEQLDAFLESIGAEPDAGDGVDDGWRSCRVHDESVVAVVAEDDGEVVFRVAVNVMPVPSDPPIVVRLLRELAEVNSALLGYPRLSVRGGIVWMSAGRPVARMEAKDFGELLMAVVRVGAVASNDLNERFWQTTRSPAPVPARASTPSGGVAG